MGYAADPRVGSLLGDYHDAGGFGHREHLHLAWTLLREDPDEAETRMLEAIRHVSSSAGVPEKASVTLTRAWLHVVALAMRRERDPGRFEELLDRHPALLRSDLLDRHYRRETLFSESARARWVEPDLAPIPTS